MDAYTELFDNFVFRALGEAAVSMIIRFLGCLLFAKFAVNAQPYNFILISSCFGMCYMPLIYGRKVFLFGINTVAFYTASFVVALIVKRSMILKTENTLKLAILIYSSMCFRVHLKEENLQQYVFIFIVMTVKMLCAAQHLEKENRFKIPKVFVLFSYLSFTPWISFRDYLHINNTQNRVNEAWKLLVTSSISRCFIFKVCSEKFLDFEIIDDFYLEPQLLSIWRAFQSRLKYYYQAQSAELEILGLYLKRFAWTKHTVFNLSVAESSILMKDSFLNYNLILRAFFRERYGGRNPKSSSLIDTVAIIAVLSTYSTSYSVLWALVYAGMHVQEKALKTLASFYNICLFGCVSPIFLILQNQFRISVLFIKLEPLSLYTSLTYTIFAIGIDVGILVFVAIHRKIKSRLLN